MQEDLEQKLSILFDGELDIIESIELFEQLEKNSHLKTKWQRYNAVRLALKNGICILPDANFTERVSKAIESEPSFLVPQSKGQATRTIGIALAASVAFFALMLTRQSPIQGDSSKDPINAVKAVKVAEQSAVQLASEVKADSKETPHPYYSRFNDYLVTHSESAYSAGTQSLLPYARVVSYKSN